MSSIASIANGDCSKGWWRGIVRIERIVVHVMGDMMSHPSVVAVTDATFTDQVLGASNPVLLKFEAQWCGPCKAMRPMIDEIAQEYAGRLTIGTVDVDANGQTTHRLGVRGVPTVLLFKDGQVVGQKVGLPRKADLTAMLDRMLG
jgi:thioredoxin